MTLIFAYKIGKDFKAIFTGSGFTWKGNPDYYNPYTSLKEILRVWGDRYTLSYKIDPNDLQDDIKTLQDYLDKQKETDIFNQIYSNQNFEFDLSTKDPVNSAEKKCDCKMITLMRTGCKCGGK